MALKVGARFGRYEVTALIGEGGMGQVWQATDPDLKRHVALKVLPDAFVDDSDRVARFQREARIVASLNHPGIGAIYGIETVGDTKALVLEYVEGPTLADRIAQGPIAVDDALPIARQVAEALEVAHESGIVHRDLKPANIKVRPDGIVKVLDFGLATAACATTRADASEALTVTSGSALGGGFMGSAAYVAPEQARGRPVDKRADIWAFGCVLYEMLAGRRVFAGDDTSEVLAAVVLAEPDWSRLPRGLPDWIEHLLHRCLERDPWRRRRDIGEARLALQQPAPPWSDAPTARWGTRGALTGATTLALAMLCAAVLWGWMPSWAPPTARSPVAFTVNAPTGVPVLPWILADEKTLVFTGFGDGPARLFARAYDEWQPRAIAAAGARDGYVSGFSPDERWLLVSEFGPEGRLLRVPLVGGSGTPIAVAHGRTASWGPDDQIVFGSRDGLWIVAATGGTPRQLTVSTDDEESHFFPHVLPNGRGVLFEVWTGDRETAHLAVHDFRTGVQSVLLPGMSPQFAVTGHLVFWRYNSLWAAPFDMDTLTVEGAPTPVLDGVSANFDGYAHYGIGRDGTLAYVPPEARATRRTLVWVDRNGQEQPLAVEPAPYGTVSLSPDGRRVALEIHEVDAPSPLIRAAGNTEIWLLDLEDDSLIRLTVDRAADRWPLWMPDGTRLVFSSERGPDAPNLYAKTVDGASEPVRLARSSNLQRPYSVTPDGRTIVFLSGRHLYMLDHEERVTDLLPARQGAVSPDGRWLALVAMTSGRDEVYVRPFPNVGDAQWPISNGPGACPVWGPNGRSLFFQRRDAPGEAVKLMQAEIHTEPTFRPGPVSTVFEGAYRFGGGDQCPAYDTRDGERFLMVREDDSEPLAETHIVVVQGWLDALVNLVPVS